MPPNFPQNIPAGGSVLIDTAWKMVPRMKRVFRGFGLIHSCEELIAEVLKEVSKKPYAAVNTTPEAYVLGIARHLARKEIERLQRERRVFDHKGKEEIVVTYPAPDQLAKHDPILRRVLCNAVAQLSPLEHEAFLLLLDNTPGSEATSLLGCAEVTFRQRALRARRKLQAYLIARLGGNPKSWI